MWECEEIQEKNDELTRDSEWFFCIGDQIQIQKGARGTKCVPLPRFPRNDRRMDLTLQLLNAYYRAPQDFRSRCGTYPMAFANVRAWLLRNMVNPPEAAAASYFHQTGAALPTELSNLLKTIAVRVLTTPAGPGIPRDSFNSQDGTEDVVVALTEIIVANGVVDVVVWSMLWVWAYGGPNGQARIRTRAAAVRALGVIAQRNPKLVGGVAAAKSIETLSNQLQRGVWSYAEAKEWQAFATTAALAAGSIAAAGAPVDPALLSPAAFLPPGMSSAPTWLPIIGAIGAVSLLAGVVLLLTRPRADRQKRMVGWSRARSAA